MSEIGQRVAEYRQRAGYTQQELADEAEIERTALAKMEKGQRRVGALELAALARVLNARMDWFVQPAPESVVAYRSALAPDAPTSAIDHLVESLARNVDFVAEYRPKRFTALAGQERALRSRNEAEHLAGDVRGWTGIDPDEPITGFAEVAAGLGAMTFCLELGPDAPEGASAQASSGGIAVVNGTLKVGRRRLVAAHELGHLITRDGYRIDWRVDSPDADIAESRLDQFARALLLPQRAVLDMFRVKRGGGMREAAIRTASEYQVDMATLARRLLDLGAVSVQEATDIRAIRTTQSDIVEFDLVVRDDLHPPSAPRPYQKAVLDMYRADTITASRAVGLLVGTLAESDLPDRPRLPEAAGWSVL
ncbi:MAG TPA: XRE family transcriptional regulator [Aldersonia sp.]